MDKPMTCPVAHVPASELLSRDFARCPFPKLAELQKDAPVHQVENMPWYLVTRYDICAQVLRDTETFSSEHDDFGPALKAIGIAPDAATVAKMQAMGGARGNMVGTIPHRDPPTQTRLRNLVVEAVTKRFGNWEQFIEDQCAKLVKVFDGRKEVDLVKEVGAPLPIAVIADILNIQDYVPKIKDWSNAVSKTSGRYPEPQDWEDQARAMAEQRVLFTAELRKRLANPSDDLTGLLAEAIREATAPGADEEGLDFEEAVELMTVILLGGNETTTQMFGSIFYYLATEPDLLDRIRADERVIDKVIEEGLRLATPVFTMMRFCKRDGEIAGVKIPKGSIVSVCFNQANRDPNVFKEPDSFDLTRTNPRRHFAFGKGIHMCPGAALARLEGHIWLRQMSEKVKRVTLADADAVRYDAASLAVRGMTSLRVNYELLESAHATARKAG